MIAAPAVYAWSCDRIDESEGHHLFFFVVHVLGVLGHVLVVHVLVVHVLGRPSGMSSVSSGIFGHCFAVLQRDLCRTRSQTCQP